LELLPERKEDADGDLPYCCSGATVMCAELSVNMAFSFERDIMPRCLRRTTTTILLLLCGGGGDSSVVVVVVVVDVMNGDDGEGGVETLCGRSSGTILWLLLLFAGAEKPSGSPQDALCPPVVMAGMSRRVDSTLLSDQNRPDRTLHLALPTKLVVLYRR
jgi:hypothetical protein